jgi:hypothetical protein
MLEKLRTALEDGLHSKICTFKIWLHYLRAIFGHIEAEQAIQGADTVRTINYIFIVLGMLILCIGCSGIRDTVTSCPSLPPVPQGAEDVVTGKDLQDREFTMFLMKSPPDFALSYYKDALSRSGWKIAIERIEGYRFSYPTSYKEGPCVVDVLTSKAVDGRTNVVVNVIANARAK